MAHYNPGVVRLGRRRMVSGSIAVVAVLIAAMMLIPMAPVMGAEARGPSTFDVYTSFFANTVSPSGNGCRTGFGLSVRSIYEDSFAVRLSVQSCSPYLSPVLTRRSVRLRPNRKKVPVQLVVRVKGGAPEGHVGWVKVTGERGAEKHDLWFRVTALDAKPEVALYTEDGAKEQSLQLSNGEPVQIDLVASNAGSSSGEFPLTFDAPPGWGVSFRDRRGRDINSISVKGVIPYLEMPQMAFLKAVVTPPADFPKSPPTPIELKVGDAGARVEIARKGMLWSANNMGGIYPHVHQVAGGGTTTYLMDLTNTTGRRATFRLGVKGVPAGWSAALSHRRVRLGPGKSRKVKLALVSPPGASPGDLASFQVEAMGNGRAEQVELAARVSDTPKVYYFSIDSMSYNYLTFNQQGTGPGGPGDWLTPNLHRFMEDATTYTDARAHLPAATDMNHTSALNGCYPGTEGIYCVSMTFNGTNPQGHMVTQPNSLDHSLTVHQGQEVRLERVFELAKRNNPEALCCFLSNKNWLTLLESDGAQEAVERAVGSDTHPVYMNDPESYVLGDPPSDSNALIDPLQVSMTRLGLVLPPGIAQATGNIAPYDNPLANVILSLLGPQVMQDGLAALLRTTAMPANVAVGGGPGTFAQDSYFGDALMSMIEEEDPDVLYCNLAELDETGHLLGSSEDLSEWDGKGTRRIHDDTSGINCFAKREDPLDVLKEADIIFGRFIDELKRRGTYDSSVIVMLADHGMVNYKRAEDGFEVLDNRKLLRDHGLVAGTDFDCYIGLTSFDLLFSRDKTNVPLIEQVLEDSTVDDPEKGRINPLVVFNREEMKSGVDERTGMTVKPGELYSSYWTQFDDAPADTMKWPDLITFVMEKYCSSMYADVSAEGANAIGFDITLNMPPDLRLMMNGGHFSFDTTHVPLMFKAPGTRGGTEVDERVYLSDIPPTIYGILGWETPAYIDGAPLPLP